MSSLWQLLTGRRFAEARTDDENAAPAPSAHNPDVSPALDAVVARALARKADQRYQDAAQLHEALRAFLPPGFVPERALAALLARHFDVTRERRMLAAEVERATRALRGVRAVDQTVGRERPRVARVPRRLRGSGRRDLDSRPSSRSSWSPASRSRPASASVRLGKARVRSPRRPVAHAYPEPRCGPERCAGGGASLSVRRRARTRGSR